MGGFHPRERGAELAGSLFQLGLRFMAVAVLSVRDSPVRIGPLTPRLLAIGAIFGVLAAMVAVSPLGKRSGAHLNPAVAVGFFRRGHVHGHDVLDYMPAQVSERSAPPSSSRHSAARPRTCTTRLRGPGRTRPPQPRSASKPG